MLDMRLTITKHCGLAAVLFSQLTAGQRLHPVDLSSVVCHGKAGHCEVPISLSDLPAGDEDTPHVLTFFRSEDSNLAIQFELRDAHNIPVIERRTVHLLAVPSAKKHEHSQKARHLAYSSYKSSSYRGSSSSSSSSSSWSSLGSSSSYTLNGAFSGSSSSSSRRRGMGVGGTSWSSEAQGVGAVGILEPDLLQGRYPGGFSKTDYGWSGAKALAAGSVLGYPMAACTFDARACRDYMAYRGMKGALHEIKADNDAKHELDQCEVTDASNKTKGAQKWKGNCKQCFEKFPVHLCTVNFRPDKDLNRDDLMELGFIPSHHQGPLKLKIFKLHGPDYTRSRICAPQKSKKKSQTLHPADVFAVLSKVDVLSESEYEYSLFREHPRTTTFCIAATVACCCCWGCCMFWFWNQLRGLKQDENDDQELDSYNNVQTNSPMSSPRDQRSVSREKISR